MSTRRLHNQNAISALMSNSVAHLLFSAYAKRHNLKAEDLVITRVEEKELDFRTSFKIEFQNEGMPGFVEFGYTIH